MRMSDYPGWLPKDRELFRDRLTRLALYGSESTVGTLRAEIQSLLDVVDELVPKIHNEEDDDETT